MGVDFNSNGTKMFVVGTVENKIFEFDLTTGFDVSTATKNSNECDFVGIGSDVVDIEFNSDGTKLFLVDIGGDDAIEEFDLSTAYDVSTCTNVEEHFAGEFNLVGIEFNPSGTKLFIYDTTGTDKIKQYSKYQNHSKSN